MNIAFIGTSQDTPYLPYLKKYIHHVGSTFVVTEEISTLTELFLYCKKRSVTGVLCNQPGLLKKLVGKDGQKAPSIDNYAGSYFLSGGIEIVFVQPLEHLLSVPYGPFLFSRYISKLTAPETWPTETTFTWEIGNESNLQSLYDSFTSCTAIAEDIETFKENLAIRCVGFAGIWIRDGIIRTHCVVIPCTSEYFLAWIRKFNDLQIGKIFQNGKYDIAYLSRYNAVPHSWFWDTAHMFHSWYSELPKDLGFLNAFFVRSARYWKDDANTQDLEEYYLYNAKDLWATANVFLAWILQAPQWAKDNYLQEFPLVFPCHLAEMTGILRDEDTFNKVLDSKSEAIETEYVNLRKMVNTPTFNTNSAPQVKSLLTILGCKDLPNGDAKSLAKARLRHPLNDRIIGKLVSIRKNRKLVSSYFKDEMTLKNRFLYNLNPHGTDSARLASTEHHFWCGINIQNIVSGDIVKQCFVADDGFLFGEADYEQAESRDTAYLSGEQNLLSALEPGKDFHSVNASNFFGISIDTIVDPVTKKVIKRPGEDPATTPRQLGKKINHGCAYGMGPAILIGTMGEDKVWKACELLKLRERFPMKVWGLVEISTYLIDEVFHKTFPGLRRDYYPAVAYEVDTHGSLTSPALPIWTYELGADGIWNYVLDYAHKKPWVRKCFTKIEGNRHALNSAVAHKSQNLNAQTLNRAWMLLFYNVWLRYPDHFKLIAQIHDSVLFQYRKGHEYLLQLVADNMRIPFDVKDIKGVTRRLVVPVAIKSGGKYWSQCE